MERTGLNYLNSWLLSAERKPLVLRGARQVGKTWIVRELARRSKRQLIELNFEKQPAYASLFDTNDPQQILLNLSAAMGITIDPANAVLFLDEIQSASHLLAKLRWFAEDLPLLPVIAAGSLLEFVIGNHEFSMPVGRITYMHLEPLSFEEFLLAKNNIPLVNYLNNYSLDHAIPEAIHTQLSTFFKEYMFIGGMPASVKEWISSGSLENTQRIKNDLLATYRDDFAKYRGRLATERLDEVMMATPAMLGRKFVYAHVNSEIASAALKQALTLLEQARICHRVKICSADGVPLAAEIKDKQFKEIFIDVGLCSTALGLNFIQFSSISDIEAINNGGLAEQVAGQLLRTIQPAYIEPSLYYWHRAESNSNAEIDYIIQYGGKIIPIEIKAGSAGGMKSLHLFMEVKKLDFALRFYAGLSSMTDINVKNYKGDPISYRLLSLPFYLIGQLDRLLALYS